VWRTYSRISEALDTFGDLEMALNLELHGHTYALGDCCYVLDTHIEQHRIPLVDLPLVDVS
jgi:hypothetical protein